MDAIRQSSAQRLMLKGTAGNLDMCRAVERIDDTLQIVKRRIAAGDLAPVEQATVQARLDAQRALQPVAEASVRAYAIALGTLLGALPEKELGLVETAPNELTPPPIPVGMAVAEQFPRLTISASERFRRST